jgi:alkanesulfonate monooxygenase SsuD/methylene tetrahydromethanopterin reductase-like flavin-dependent oxidoreductase (luciferase family)
VLAWRGRAFTSAGRVGTNAEARAGLRGARGASDPPIHVKIGILQFFSWPERRAPLPAVYERALDRIEIMENGGYDAVWLTEHHFSDYSVCPSIPVMGAYAAARTKRLRIGTAVTLAGLYHPLRLAEEIALLDILSGGRVNWGAGRGFDSREFRAFGVSPDETHARFREAVEIVIRAWSDSRLSFRGRFYSFEDLEVLPKPLQRPHPPAWMAASTDDAIRWAAAAGHSILMSPHPTHAEIGEQRMLYQRELESHGHSAAGREIPVARLIAIAPTGGEARSVATAGVEWLLKTYVNPTGRGDPNEMLQRYLDSVVIHGTPEAVLEKIQTLREEIRLDSLIAAPLSHETFLLLTDRVLPKLI